MNLSNHENGEIGNCGFPCSHAIFDLPQTSSGTVMSVSTLLSRTPGVNLLLTTSSLQVRNDPDLGDSKL